MSFTQFRKSLASRFLVLILICFQFLGLAPLKTSAAQDCGTSVAAAASVLSMSTTASPLSRWIQNTTVFSREPRTSLGINLLPQVVKLVLIDEVSPEELHVLKQLIEALKSAEDRGEIVMPILLTKDGKSMGQHPALFQVASQNGWGSTGRYFLFAASLHVDDPDFRALREKIAATRVGVSRYVESLRELKSNLKFERRGKAKALIVGGLLGIAVFLGGISGSLGSGKEPERLTAERESLGKQIDEASSKILALSNPEGEKLQGEPVKVESAIEDNERSTVLRIIILSVGGLVSIIIITVGLDRKEIGKLIERAEVARADLKNAYKAGRFLNLEDRINTILDFDRSPEQSLIYILERRLKILPNGGTKGGPSVPIIVLGTSETLKPLAAHLNRLEFQSSSNLFSGPLPVDESFGAAYSEDSRLARVVNYLAVNPDEIENTLVFHRARLINDSGVLEEPEPE